MKKTQLDHQNLILKQKDILLPEDETDEMQITASVSLIKFNRPIKCLQEVHCFDWTSDEVPFGCIFTEGSSAPASSCLSHRVGLKWQFCWPCNRLHCIFSFGGK